MKLFDRNEFAQPNRGTLLCLSSSNRITFHYLRERHSTFEDEATVLFKRQEMLHTSGRPPQLNSGSVFGGTVAYVNKESEFVWRNEKGECSI